MIDLANLERIIGLSICYADAFPTSLWRKSRFIDAILDGKKLTGADRDKERGLINEELDRMSAPTRSLERSKPSMKY